MTTEVEKKDDAQPTADELWDKVQADRSTQADGGAQTDATDPLAGVPEPTRKLIEEIDRLKTTLTEQGTELQKVSQQMSTVNGAFGTFKQRLDASQVTLQKIAPTADAIEAERAEKAKKEADEKASRRTELLTRMGDMVGLTPEELAELGLDAKPTAEETPKPKAEPEPKPDQATAGDSENQDEKIRVLTLQRELSDRVPGWLKTRETAEFKAWRDGAGKEVFTAKAGSWDPDEVAEVFKAFDKHKSDAAKVAQVEKDRQERLRRGENPQPRGSSTGDVDLSPDAAWNKVKRDREKARASG